MRRAAMAVGVCAVVAMVASAAWAVGVSIPPAYKWEQLPDLLPTGMDVRVSTLNGLADDFLCTGCGPITDIHIWGSWKGDVLPQGATGGPDPGAVHFGLAIFSDIPASQSQTGYSMPNLDDQLWGMDFTPGEFTVQSITPQGPEGWYGPTLQPPSLYLPGNHYGIYQYNFFIDPQDAFPQQGTPEQPIVYWLGVILQEDPPEGVEFGWKTSPAHWGDDAVVAFVIPSEGEAHLFETPVELLYPLGHPYAGQSVDLAFRITPEPATLGLVGLGLAGLALRRRRGVAGLSKAARRRV